MTRALQECVWMLLMTFSCYRVAVVEMYRMKYGCDDVARFVGYPGSYD